jgi:cytochrome b subunit of formate dehydrogenase
VTLIKAAHIEEVIVAARAASPSSFPERAAILLDTRSHPSSPWHASAAQSTPEAGRWMKFFAYARDFYSNWPLPQKLAWGAAVAGLFLVIVYAGLHLFRRGLGAPVPCDEGAQPPVGVRAFKRWEIGARLYHWGNFLIVLGLIISGISFWFPGLIFSLKLLIGYSWLTFHVVLAGLFILGVLLHVVFAVTRTNPRNMWFERRDWPDLKQLARYYFGLTSGVPKFGKFDVWQKIFHAFVTVLALMVIGSGVNLFINAEQFAALDHAWLRNQRLIHDIGAFLFAAALVGHGYTRLVKLNWPKLLAMFTGTLSWCAFRVAHDWNRWPAEPAEPPTDSSADRA